MMTGSDGGEMGEQSVIVVKRRILSDAEAIAALNAIHADVQSKFHDQWDWMDAAFYVHALECRIADLVTEHDRIKAAFHMEVAQTIIINRMADEGYVEHEQAGRPGPGAVYVSTLDGRRSNEFIEPTEDNPTMTFVRASAVVHLLAVVAELRERLKA